LESFIRQDNYELTQSQVVRLESVTTWVYYDHRSNAHRKDPLPNVVNDDGSPARTTTRSQYMKWQNDLDAFVIRQVFAYEHNGDDPETVYDFFETAMEDCLETGATEFFVEFSSHAAGFLGFGGDEDPDRNRRRSLTQSNADLVGALSRVLQEVPGAPEKFDVIGFDACLMQAVGAADDYRDIARYILASEAVEPGHGWAYQTLTQADTALDLAIDIHSNFLSQTQGHSFHLTPKTLSIVDTAKFSVFLSAWDTLSAAMEDLLESKDPEFFTQINRARNQAIMFTSVIDLEGTNRPSAMDIGSFLQELTLSCVPDTESSVARLLQSTLDFYDDMFVVQGVGEGTVAATGMHITWPVRSEYFVDQAFFDQIMFDSDVYATTDAPNWLSFLKRYYGSSTPPAGGTSVCTAGVTSSVVAPAGQLIIQPRLSGIRNGGHRLDTEISRETDWMLVEFGIDLTPLLNNNNNNNNDRRRLKSWKERWMNPVNRDPDQFMRDRPSEEEKRVWHPRPEAARKASRQARQRERNRQRNLKSQDYFILFGGDVAGNYNQSNFDAFWDRQFYLFEDSDGNIDFLYGFDNGNGQKEVPVVYIPESSSPVSSDDVYFGLTEQAALTRFGGESGYLSFSVDNIQGDNLIPEVLLYTSDGNTYSETPREAGGQILPIIYVEGMLDGDELDVLVGGFFSTIIEWSDANGVNFFATDASAYLALFEVDFLVVDILAVDDDESGGSNGGSDFTFFVIDADGNAFINDSTDSSGAEESYGMTSYYFVYLLAMVVGSIA
jgi:hypothetical protein